MATRLLPPGARTGPCSGKAGSWPRYAGSFSPGSFGIVIFTIFMPIYMFDQLKLRGMEIGAVMSASTILIALLLRPMGRLADR